MTVNRSVCTLGAEKCTPRTLGEAIHCVARHSSLPARELAARIGVGYDWFTKATDDSGSRAKAPAWLMLALAIHTRRTDHLRRQAADAGLVAYEMPNGQDAGDRQVGAVMREIGEWLTEWGSTVADGVVTRDEFEKVRQQWIEAVALGSRAMDDLESRIADRPRPQAVRA